MFISIYLVAVNSLLKTNFYFPPFPISFCQINPSKLLFYFSVQEQCLNLIVTLRSADQYFRNLP